MIIILYDCRVLMNNTIVETRNQNERVCIKHAESTGLEVSRDVSSVFVVIIILLLLLFLLLLLLL